MPLFARLGGGSRAQEVENAALKRGPREFWSARAVLSNSGEGFALFICGSEKVFLSRTQRVWLLRKVNYVVAQKNGLIVRVVK